MTSKFIKVPALQGVSSVEYNQILDFDLLNYGYVDPQRSYISVNADIATTETDPNSGIGVHAVYTTFTNNASYKNSVFIGDYELRSSSVGVLESVLDSNVINASFDSFNRDFEQVLSDNYKTLAQFVDPSRVYFNKVDSSPFRVLSQTVPSQNITHQLKIKLPDISPMMKQISVYDCEALGNTRLRIRWDDRVLNDPVEYMPYDTMWGVRPCANKGNADPNNTVVMDAVSSAINKVIDATDAELPVGTNVIATYVSGGTRDPILETTVAAVNIAAQVATITLANNLAAGDKTSVQLAAYKSKVQIAQPVNGATSVFVNDTTYFPVDSDWVKFTYLNKQVVIAYPTAGVNNVFVAKTITGVSVLPNGTVRLDFTGGLPSVGTAAGALYILGNTAVFQAVAGDNITYTMANTTLQSCGLWVGQKINITSLTAAGAKQGISTLITSLTQVGTNVQVVVADALANSANSIKFRCVPAATTTLTMSNPMLVMKTLNSGNKKLARYLAAESKEVTFSTYSIERASILSNQQSFNRIFDCEAGCSNVFFLLVNRQAGVNVIAESSNIDSYRMRLNDIMITNRDVSPLTPLYFDGLIQCLQSSNLAVLRNLLGECSDSVCIPCAMIPDPSQLNRVQLNLNTNNSGNEYTVYCVKEKMKMLSVGKGGARLQ